MNILFLGTHGQYNLGDELLLETFLDQLGAEHSFQVNSYDPEMTCAHLQGKFNISTFHTTRQLPHFLIALLRSDVLVFGGGSIIKELYASVGRNQYATLLMIWATVTFAKKVGRKKVFMSNIGVGPLFSPKGKRLAGRILRQVDFLSVRDKRSLQTCQALNLPLEKVRLVPDAVFANPPHVFATDWAPAPQTGRLCVALNLNYDIANREAWEGFLAGLADMLKIWNGQQPLEIHALPMQSRFKAHDDLSVLTEFCQRLENIPILLHNPQTPQEAGGIIARCDVLLAERLHALVMAAILGKPFFGLVYDVKVEELVGYLGMSAHSIDINQPFKAETLLSGVQSVWEQQAEISRLLLERSTTLRAELASYFDELKAHLPKR